VIVGVNYILHTHRGQLMVDVEVEVEVEGKGG
jgi:hypothetical protein